MGENQPAKDSTEVTWIGKDRMRIEDGNDVTIVRTDLKKMYMLDMQAKTFTALDLPVDIEKLLRRHGADDADGEADEGDGGRRRRRRRRSRTGTRRTTRSRPRFRWAASPCRSCGSRRT
jgi:hypothetical protein